MLKQAVILVGGLGTRLAERTRAVPKPLLGVGGRPFIEYLLDELTRYSVIESIVLLAGYHADQVVAQYGGKRWRNATISVVTEPAQLGTGGALKYAEPHLHERFFLLNGDSFFDVNLLDLATVASRSGAVVCMALKRDQPGDRYGRVVLEDGIVRRFVAASEQPNGPINSGVYCVDRKLVDLIGPEPCSLEQEIFPKLVAHDELQAMSYDGFFIDIGVPTDFDRAQTAMPAMLQRPAVFFDRDGVLNVDKNYVHRIEDFEWIEGAREAVKLCNDAGYLTFVVTNQAGVARGYYGEDAVHRLHDWMSTDLAGVGAHIEEFEYCPYHEDGVVKEFRGSSHRRKPAPGMLLDCFGKWPVRKEGSLLVGDKAHDIEAATTAGIRGYLFERGNLADFIRPLLRH